MHEYAMQSGDVSLTFQKGECKYDFLALLPPYLLRMCCVLFCRVRPSHVLIVVISPDSPQGFKCQRDLNTNNIELKYAIGSILAIMQHAWYFQKCEKHAWIA